MPSSLLPCLRVALDRYLTKRDAALRSGNTDRADRCYDRACAVSAWIGSLVIGASPGQKGV